MSTQNDVEVGRAAYVAGKKLIDNPYRQDSEAWRSWHWGYHLAHMEGLPRKT